MNARKRSRWGLSLAAAGVLGAALLAAFWPRAVAVDIARVVRGELTITINEDGRTRVHEAYVVATPVAGRLMRVGVEPGDAVIQNETIIARMMPTNPSVLDVRTREQARAAVTAAEAALRVARADLNKATADLALAESDLSRAETLVKNERVSEAALDRAKREARVAQAVVDRAEAAISVRTAELSNAQAKLIGFDDRGMASAISAQATDEIPLFAPATGRVLQVIEQNETTLSAGAPILEIGDIDGGLEIVAELLSSDAVKVTAGDRVVIEKWGGDAPLRGSVDRIDPIGFTKFSALGVEEQRVNVVIAFDEPAASKGRLGHGYRVEVQIVVQEENDVLIAPASALFRTSNGWAAFVVENGRISEKAVTLSASDGIVSGIAGGLSEGDAVVVYPSAGLSAGDRVKSR